ncbi:MAG: phosphomannomutase / phosphoglucomutase [Candidatus Binatota bacterium]|nr:phosphomannomutase / phosphoglucomutase [Candidatus Binatota bacterium]
MNPSIFREYDLRGIADRDFTDEDCRLLGRGTGSLLRRAGKRRITLGRDCRLHSERIRAALLDGLLQTGLEVTDVGICATPLLYFSVHHWEMDGGVMVTASHNPSPDNGLKICVGKSTIHGAEIQELRRVIEAGDFVAAAGGTVSERAVLPDYVEYVTGQIRSPRKLRLVIDAGNGPGGIAALPIFRALGHEVIDLYCDMDGRFPNHHPDPTVVENLRDLRATVVAGRADLGIAYDGDADRLGVVDERGQVLWGDQLMIVFARSILAERGSGTFIADVKCSRTLYDDVPKHGGRIIMWKTGHSLIKQKMKEESALLAGEMSGHLFFADRYYGYDDAIYSSARLVEIVSEAGRSLGELLEGVPRALSTPEIRVEVPEESKFAIVERVKRHFAARYDTIEIDGARINFPGGWGLVRASNTQAVLVLRFEAEDEPTLARIRSEVESKVAELSR